jgi:N utilization substance protein A
MINDLLRTIDQVSRDKGIDSKTLIEALEEAVSSAVKKKFGAEYELEVSFNMEIGEIEVFEIKEEVEEVTDEKLQVSLK